MQSRLLSVLPGFVHGYSTRDFGDMRNANSRASFLKRVGIQPGALQLSRQVHSATIGLTGDGLVSGIKGEAVGVVVADCVPLLFADTKKNTVAAVHAGWKGTVGNIAKQAVLSMNSDPKDLFVSIGPHIGPCCYTVPKTRADSFSNQCTYFDGTSWHLDIGLANRMQLIEVGILPAHIDAPVVCTSCQIDRFFSYRKDTHESFGEIIAVIAVQ